MDKNIKNDIAECITKLRIEKPHIHCITNEVAQNLTANILLAINCTPSMTIAEKEILQFVEKANGVLVNLGTMDEKRIKAIETIMPLLKTQKIIWTLDPVMVHLSSERLKLAKKLVELKPSIVRCNQLEAEALFGKSDLAKIAKDYETCIVLSGEKDKVFDGNSTLCIENGHEWMSRVTAMGCVLNAVLCACAVVEKNRKIASGAAVVMFGIAGERAAKKSKGLGTFLPNFVDELYNLKAENMMEEAKINET